MLDLDGDASTEATAPVEQSKSNKLYEQLKQHLRAFTRQLYSIQEKVTCYFEFPFTDFKSSTL